ncbi:MAG: spermidine synthase [Nocardioides sp.]
MDRMEYVEIARAESERGELVLRQRQENDGPSVLELRANGVFVMDTQENSTEQALADAALGLVAEPRDVLVGGLGLGYTMHRVLADQRVERCSVVEIEPALVEWMRDGTVPHGPAMLADERANPVVADIGPAVGEVSDASYDLVLLDVDNGPDHLVHEHNAALYRPPFLTEVRRILRPGGAVAIWSADASPELEATLEQVFGNAETAGYDVTLQDREEKYWLHVARVGAVASAE